MYAQKNMVVLTLWPVVYIMYKKFQLHKPMIKTNSMELLYCSIRGGNAQTLSGVLYGRLKSSSSHSKSIPKTSLRCDGLKNPYGFEFGNPLIFSLKPHIIRSHI